MTANSPAFAPMERSRKLLLFTGLCLLATIAVLGLTARRIVRTHQTPGPFNSNAQGFCDFQNGVYFPSTAFLNRLSPYSQQYATEYPVARSTPFYSPFAFALHLPFALPSLPVAEVIYFGWMVVLVLSIAALTAGWICQSRQFAVSDSNQLRWAIFSATALMLVASRGGQQTLYTGYFTFEIILAVLAAVHYAQSRPWLSGLSLAVVACKPNYLLPIGFLMLARGNWKALSIGAAISVLSAAICAAWMMPEGGIAELVQQIDQTQQIHKADSMERPINSWVRIDWLAIIAKWLAWDPHEWQYLLFMLLMIGPAAMALRWHHAKNSTDQGSVIEIGGVVILLTTLVSVYHQAYDAALLTPVISLLALMLLQPVKAASQSSDSFSRLSKLRLFLLLALIGLPLANYCSSQIFLQRFKIEGFAFQLVTSLNGMSLMIAWVWLLAILLQQTHRTKTATVTS